MIFLWILLVWNIVVFGFYAVDKYKAIHHLWRIPEKVLLTEAIIGGGLGAILAGQICHHKTRKWYFWLAWIIGVIVDIALVLVIINLM
ncbi:DUF1294 domain-containing protein [Lactococcus allomyrinae]|uniref:DUF1294 domain-containing protein n=1 Tax=Lactococcus allomyrinae TaxID=2419773 RepID=A0A387BHY6_9LACT|nr:DUF1294 domain-containing protein [Lactococcus allomyrinae]AYG00726.1 DUF1294 domain-containing protein [Lactococcus allomyrinae]